ncbi:MAG TPA: molybdopterin cofactor-binding domain-containing protein [Candidatus Binatia bacterium]
MFRKNSPNLSEAFTALLARGGNRPVEAVAHTEPDKETLRFSSHSFGAVFVEVAVDPQLGIVRVPRVVAVYDVGKLLNEKTARASLSAALCGASVWHYTKILTSIRIREESSMPIWPNITCR